MAIVAVEDRRFVQHKGVDWRGTTRALLSNAQGDAGQQGGSTITQQYVKNYLFLVQAQTDAAAGRRHRQHPGAQAAGGQARAHPRAARDQGRHPGRLPEPGRLPAEHLRRGGHRGATVRHPRRRPRPAAGCPDGRHGQQPQQVRPAGQGPRHRRQSPARHRAGHPATRTARSPRASTTRPSPLRSTSPTAPRSPADACRPATPRSTATSASTSWTTSPMPA